VRSKCSERERKNLGGGAYFGFPWPDSESYKNVFARALSTWAADRNTGPMKNDRSRYYGHRFPLEIISYSVWVYHRFCLSFRDVEDVLAERGIIVSYETIRLWCQKFGPD
jgi:hypothetical protein